MDTPIKIEVDKKVSEFIKGNGNMVLTYIGENDDYGDEYYFIPYWFKKTDQENVFEPYHLDKPFPVDLLKVLGVEREKIINVKNVTEVEFEGE